MRRLLLVARHEFVKYVTRRGFIISIFMMPLWIAFAAIVPRWIEHNAPPRSVMVVDRAGGYAEAIAAEMAERNSADALDRLSAYAQAHADMAALRRHDRALYMLLTASEGHAAARAQLRTEGGVGGAVRRLAPYLKRDAPAFQVPPPHLGIDPAPAALARPGRTEFARRATRTLRRPGGPDAILVVPRGFGSGDATTAEYWSSGPPQNDLEDFLSGALTQALRRRALHRVAPAASRDVLEARADLRSIDPTQDSAGPDLAEKVQRFAPSVLAFLLVLTIFMNAASLMSAVIEEKSSRIVEVILSCVSAREFMVGKLLGAAGASLLTLALWLGMALLAAWIFVPGGLAIAADLLGGLVGGPLLPMLLVCFVCGLLIYASIFLAIGSMAASIQDAQALLGPTMILIMAPLILMPALLHDPNGTIATVLTWIPLYTPFFMMFRLPWEPPQAEVWLSLALMVTTAGLLVWQMGRVFAAHVLTAERPPRLGAVLRMLVGIKRAR